MKIQCYCKKCTFCEINSTNKTSRFLPRLFVKYKKVTEQILSYEHLEAVSIGPKVILRVNMQKKYLMWSDPFIYKRGSVFFNFFAFWSFAIRFLSFSVFVFQFSFATNRNICYILFRFELVGPLIFIALEKWFDSNLYREK